MESINNLSNPISTGSGGSHFEHDVQTAFVVLMLTNGHLPCFNDYENPKIYKIRCQAENLGFRTDDLLVFAKGNDEKEGSEQRIFAQIKRSISISNNKNFKKVIKDAWIDFNSDKFNKNYDKLALITGLISKQDVIHTRQILDWAKCDFSTEEFIANIKQKKYLSKTKNKKLEVFRIALENEKGSSISDDELYLFLKHFYFLGYDFDIEAGVTKSLVYSLIGQHTNEDINAIWLKIRQIVERANTTPFNIQNDKLPKYITKYFKNISPYAVGEKEEDAIYPIEETLIKKQNLALANLIGSWDEKNKSDIDIVSNIINKQYFDWIPEIRKEFDNPESSLLIKNGVISNIDRENSWINTAAQIFDNQLDLFCKACLLVLKEINPAFDLPPDERYLASINSKTPKYSSHLRKGLTETLALIGNNEKELIHCSVGKAQNIIVDTIRKLFKDSDWKIWANLDRLLPNIAEANPQEFLNIIDTELRNSPCVFDELFAQESAGITGRTYLSGLLWGLEAIAWDEKYLIHVCMVLTELASRDSGGNYQNRPINSIITILLPWLPQTNASVEVRKTAMQRIRKDYPEITWKVIKALLPESHQSSSGSYVPKWMKIKVEKGKSIPADEYWEQTNYYVDIALEIISDDIDKLYELMDKIEIQNTTYTDKLLKAISSEKIINLPEEKRLKFWKKLKLIEITQKRHGILYEEKSEKISEAIEALTPKKPENLYKILFDHSEYDLFEDDGDYEKQMDKIRNERVKAVKAVLKEGGWKLLFQFSDIIKFPYLLGSALGEIGNNESDMYLLPDYLSSKKESIREMVGNYIWRRYHKDGEVWVKYIDISKWTIDQKSKFLLNLPFCRFTWNLVVEWLSSVYVFKVNWTNSVVS